jgi:hypothetical protein
LAEDPNEQQENARLRQKKGNKRKAEGNYIKQKWISLFLVEKKIEREPGRVGLIWSYWAS